MGGNIIWFRSDEPVKFEKTELHSKLVDVLRRDMHIETLFDMQHQMLSFIQYNNSVGRADDIVLCAPTGSGKTLAYALPIIQQLHARIVPSLKAIVVVPTRDLALQVAYVFTVLANPFGISVTAVTGASSLAEEEANLVDCEILIATPGRLVDHVLRTKCVCLQDVLYLVLDESDRLLQESYDYWLQAIMPRLGKPPKHSNLDRVSNTDLGPRPSIEDDLAAYLGFSDDDDDDDEEAFWRPQTGILALTIVPSIASKARSAYGTASDESIRKILVSATPDLDPTYMAHLDIRNPMMIQPGSPDEQPSVSLSVKYDVPTSLVESGFVVRTTQQKPAALLALLGWTTQLPSPQTERLGRHLGEQSVKLVFTNSIDSAHRLTRMLELCAYALDVPATVFEMSGELSTERRRFVVDFIKGQAEQYVVGYRDARTTVIVCSDVLSRGMDILTIDCVINYDTPTHVRTYLHRAGRTARAGRPGAAATLLLQNQVHHFRTMVHEADRGDKSVKTFNMQQKEFFTTKVIDLLSGALSNLKRVLNREKINLLQKEKELPAYALFELYSKHADEDVCLTEKRPKIDEDVIEQELHGKSQKKRKRASVQNIGESEDVNETMREGDEGDDRDEIGDDNLSDLLYAQIAQNLMVDFT